MNPFLVKELDREFAVFKPRFLEAVEKQGLGEAYREITDEILMGHAVNVNRVLQEKPFIPAEALARELGMDKSAILLSYKYNQLSDTLQQEFRGSENSDYFNVVNHNFNQRSYVAVFFVGLSCPSRCSFCPNVKIDDTGKRTVARYDTAGNKVLSAEQLEMVFKDLASLKKENYGVLVKVSGGLEPLTDIKTMSVIIRLAEAAEIPVKLFTNGLLLNRDSRRRAALNTGDIRISLSTADEKLYDEICFGSSPGREKSHFKALKNNIRYLVRQRNEEGLRCRIGINFIVMPSNVNQVRPVIELAEDLGLDYIDFKPDYFSPDYIKAEEEITKEIKAVRQDQKTGKYGGMFIHFVNSLSRENFFWRIENEQCDAVKQSRHKIFITPFGSCSPIHYGAFPHDSQDMEGDLETYAIGQIDTGTGLLDILNNPKPALQINYDKLNPFELMLSLEIKREEKDADWGIPVAFSPYHTSLRDQ